MSKRLIQDIHAGISRRDWWAVETAANRLRDEVEKAVDILAGTGAGSLPNDYPLSQLAADAASPKPDTSALLLEAASALERLLERWAEYCSSTGNMEDAFYKLAKYAYADWEFARSTLSKIRGEE